MSSYVVLPDTYQHADKDILVTLVYEVLSKVIEYNDKITASASTPASNTQPEKLTRFHSQTFPNISIHEYLDRIVKYTALEPVCLLMLLLYADRIAANSAKNNFVLCSLTAHRFLIAAVSVASKAICDVYCTNSHYAKVGGISSRELSLLEMTIIDALSWHLATSNDTLTMYYKSLVENHPKYTFSVPLSSPKTQISPKYRSLDTPMSQTSTLQPLPIDTCTRASKRKAIEDSLNSNHSSLDSRLDKPKLQQAPL
ncbi:hypothetical protein BB561_000901 [Smittium simulii]|uniref:Cyclin n=1 Tax=Smittium simulii TaxID=133385 RepID=A0A2T9YX69_9FUNG|nr:hypothetical protein BB561_000901 [Smittium simulii]